MIKKIKIFLYECFIMPLILILILVVKLLPRNKELEGGKRK